jgi:MFS family permease
MNEAPQNIGHRWIIVATLFVLFAVNFADKAVIGLAAEPIMRELGLSHSAFGRIAGSFFALFSVMSLIVGVISDHIRTRWLLLGMAVIWAVSQAPLLIVATPVTLMVSRMMLGAAEGPTYPVAIHALYKWFPDHKRALPTALMTMGGAVGTGMVAPLVTWIIVTYGWRSAFAAVAIVSLMWAALWLVVGKEGPLGAGSHAHETASAALAEVLPERVPMWRLVLSRTALGSFLSAFSAYVLLTIATIWLPSYLARAAGYTMTQVGLIVVVPAFVQMLTMPLLGWWSQRLQVRGVSSRVARGVLGAAMVMASGAALMMVSQLSAGPLLIVMVTIAFSLSPFAFPSGVMMVSEISPPKQRGGMLGVNNFVFTLAGLVTPMVIGHVIDMSSSPVAGYRTGILLAGGFAVLGGLISALLVHPAADRARFAAQGSRGALVSGSR